MHVLITIYVDKMFPCFNSKLFRSLGVDTYLEAMCAVKKLGMFLLYRLSDSS